jgi:hypothetical protein
MKIMKEEYHSINPSITKLYATVLPALGHDSVGAIADLWDNSDDAEAENIGLIIQGTLSKIDRLIIYDDGIGMDAATLVESFRFVTETIHSKGDLGKFGVGGTIGSFTLGKSKRTITKQKDGNCLTAYQDLTSNNYNLSNNVCIQNSNQPEIDFFNECTNNSEQGTVIIINNLNESAIDPSKRLKSLENELIRELAQKFRSRMKENRKFWIKGDKITRLKPFDPLFRSQKKYHNIPENTVKLDYNGKQIIVRTVGLNFDIMPNSKTIQSYHNQGVYFVRNSREIIQSNNVKGLWKNNPRFNSGRVEINFTEDSDGDFNLTATKNKVCLQESLANLIYEKVVKPFRLQLENKYKTVNPDQSKVVNLELEKFTKDLESSAGSLDLPRIANANGVDDKITRTKKPDDQSKKGRVDPKGTDIKRKPKTKNRVVPQFKIENHTKCPNTHWYDIEENKMTVIINSGSDFVRNIFINGNKETKKALKTLWAAECITRYSYYETSEESTIESFADKTSAKTNEIYKHFN